MNIPVGVMPVPRQFVVGGVEILIVTVLRFFYNSHKLSLLVGRKRPSPLSCKV